MSGVVDSSVAAFLTKQAGLSGGGGLCHPTRVEQALWDTKQRLSDGAELGKTALTAFEQHASAFSEHVAKRACQAGVCRSFVTYHILADRCVGCGECLDACEEGAIVKAGAVKTRCLAKPIPKLRIQVLVFRFFAVFPSFFSQSKSEGTVNTINGIRTIQLFRQWEEAR